MYGNNIRIVIAEAHACIRH